MWSVRHKTNKPIERHGVCMGVCVQRVKVRCVKRAKVREELYVMNRVCYLCHCTMIIGQQGRGCVSWELVTSQSTVCLTATLSHTAVVACTVLQQCFALGAQCAALRTGTLMCASCR